MNRFPFVRAGSWVWGLIGVGVVLGGCEGATAPAPCAGTPMGSLVGSVIGPAVAGIPSSVSGVVVSLSTAEQVCITALSATSGQNGVFYFAQVPTTASYALTVTLPPERMLGPEVPSPRLIRVRRNGEDTANVKLYFTPQDTLLTFYVGPREIDCQGFIPQKCLLVKERPDAEYLYFIDPIQGFKFEPNYEYILKVIRRRLPESFPDGPSQSYHLVEIVAKKPV